MTKRARLHPLTFMASALSLVLLSGLLVPGASASSTPSAAGWPATGSDPAATAASIAAHGDKLPPEFNERLRYVQPDGALRVMVSLGARTSSIKSFVEQNTTALRWYSASPGFYGTVTPDQLATLLDAAFVKFIEPDYPIDYSLAASVLDVSARGTAGAPGVWSFDLGGGPRGALRSDVPALSVDQATGKGVTVAIVDSGLDKTHRDFGGWDCEAGPLQPCQSRVTRTVTTEHLIGPGFDLADESPTTDLASGHGTHVAGIIGGNGYYVRDYGDPTALEPETYGGDGVPIGVAPQANLINVKNGDSQSAVFAVAGLDWLADHAQEYGVRVANNSWGCLGGCSFNGNSAMAQTLKALYDRGVVTTFAAGNDGGNANGTSFSGDSQSPYVLSVASYDWRNHQLASSSSRGSSAAAVPDPATWTPQSEPVNGLRRPDIAAPGVSIWSARNLTGGTSSAVPRQNTGDVTGGIGCCIREYATMSGTSMATPHVSGAAALLVGACPAATPLDVMRALMANADASGVLKTGGTGVAQPFEAGYGAMNVRGALDWLLALPTCGGQPANSAPVAVDDSLSLNQGSSATVDVLGNDVDADEDELSVISVADAASGDVSLGSDGVTYTPANDFFGTDSVEYVVGDGKGGTDTGSISISVNGRPVAGDDAVDTNQDDAVEIGALANDSDPEGDVFSITRTEGATHGSVSVSAGSITYLPAEGFHGTDSFTYEIVDAKGAADVATVTVTVNGAPIAAADSAATRKKDAVRINVAANDSDPEADPFRLESSTQAAQGTVDCSATGTCTYVPNGRYRGSDSFTYVVCDLKGACDVGRVSVSVR